MAPVSTSENPSTLYDSSSQIVDLIKSKNWKYSNHKAINQSHSPHFVNYHLGLSSSKKLIGEALYQKINAIDPEECDADEESSFFVCDLGEVYRLVQQWRLKLPRVQPFYAVKCNNDLQLLKVLDQLGLGFDCASKREIEMVLDMGVSPDRIIYANPCKTSSFIRYAQQVNVGLTTVDNKDELIKISKYNPETGILLRISTDDSTATCPLSTKFGATVNECKELIHTARELNLTVQGVAFHVGSGAKDFRAIDLAIADARSLFDYALSTGLYKFSILDIGGGFSHESFEQSSNAVNTALDKYFNSLAFPDVQVIAEPGRYLSASAFTLACHIVAKRVNSDGTSRIYINDGVYGNLNCIIYDHQVCEPKVLSMNNKFMYFDNYQSNGSESHGISFSSSSASVWGPTCDALDCISSSIELPDDLQVGDWLYFDNVGSYTSAAATSFNGFRQSAEVRYVFSQ